MSPRDILVTQKKQQRRYQKEDCSEFENQASCARKQHPVPCRYSQMIHTRLELRMENEFSCEENFEDVCL
uniref:Uncharacterized protein n=1 Tax=Romanomermis culicivorax TaxID=13658 RepID=A0A915JDX3_ROMCU